MTTITEQLGRVLVGRYRLDAGLGTGSSAHVYAAFDTRLGRQVAVKLLHPGLARDEGFLRRLRAEAQAVAALNHPNVLKVFDWGEEDDGPFLVLEYLGGGSLQDLIDSGRRLDPAQAASVGAQAARGLAYAHRRGFVHRDVKPGNLLFDEDGGLRVADFGLARALAEAAWTEPAGAVLGTARYASPEQAEGRPLDDRSDVYSLALVLYEAVVGRVPFSADTTLATLMARIAAPLPIVSELGPLAPILAQAAISEPLARLDAAELADNLELLARQLPRARPLSVTHRPRLAGIGPAEPARRLAGAADRNPLGEPPPVDASSPEEILVAPDPAGAREHARASFYDAESDGSSAAAPATLALGDSVSETSRRRRSDRPHRGTRRRTGRRVLIATLVVLVLAAAGTAAALRYVVYGHRVPQLRGVQLATARSDVANAGLRLHVVGQRFSTTDASGAVLSETPRAGKLERSGVVVAVVVSKGRAPVPVPNVAGKSRAEAVSLIATAHLTARFSSAYSETITAGTVISAAPSSGDAIYGSQVSIVLSRGPTPRTVPSSLDGTAWAAAESSLTALRLVPVELQSYSTSVSSGDVISADPAPGTAGVPVGSTVHVEVSKGPRLVAVPSVSGQAIAAALSALQGAGLDVTEQVGPPNATYATTTDPSPGAEVAPGTAITLYVA